MSFNFIILFFSSPVVTEQPVRTVHPLVNLLNCSSRDIRKLICLSFAARAGTCERMVAHACMCVSVCVKAVSVPSSGTWKEKRKRKKRGKWFSKNKSRLLVIGPEVQPLCENVNWIWCWGQWRRVSTLQFGLFQMRRRALTSCCSWWLNWYKSGCSAAWLVVCIAALCAAS